MTQNTQNYFRDTYPIAYALIVGGIITTVILTSAMPEIKESAQQADTWCNQTFGDQYQGIANVKAIWGGGFHCQLENGSIMEIPEEAYQ